MLFGGGLFIKCYKILQFFIKQLTRDILQKQRMKYLDLQQRTASTARSNRRAMLLTEIPMIMALKEGLGSSISLFLSTEKQTRIITLMKTNKRLHA